MFSSEDRAAYIHMRCELQKFINGGDPKNSRQAENILKTVLECAKKARTVRWTDSEIDAVYFVAGQIFIEGDCATQAMTLDLMRKFVNHFLYDRATILEGTKSGHVKKLIMFYFHVVLRYASEPALFTKASQYAEEHTRESNPNRRDALEAFEMSCFADYAIERFEKRAVKNLLIIAKEKMLCHSDKDVLMPGTIQFINKVCESQESCGVVILVCHVLRDLFRSIALSKAFHKFDMLKGSPVIWWIMRHTDPSKKRKKCWEAVAQFIGATFFLADGDTKLLLVRMRVFPRINDMMRDGSRGVALELLDAVEAACKDSRLIYHLVSENVLLRIIPIFGDVFAPAKCRRNACQVMRTFLRNAPCFEVYRAAENGVVAAVMKLVKSMSETVVGEALRWVDMMFDDCRNAQMHTGLANLVAASGGDEILQLLRVHPKEGISGPAASIFRRMRTPGDRISWQPEVPGSESSSGMSYVDSFTESHASSGATFAGSLTEPNNSHPSSGPIFAGSSTEPNNSHPSSGATFVGSLAESNASHASSGLSSVDSSTQTTDTRSSTVPSNIGSFLSPSYISSFLSPSYISSFLRPSDTHSSSGSSSDWF